MDAGQDESAVGSGRRPPLDTSGFSVELDPTEEREQPYNGLGAPFDPDQIDVATQTLSVDSLLRRLRQNTLAFAPDLHNRAGGWTPTMQSRLIESLLLRIPVPAFYVAETDSDESWELLDGSQRTKALARFIEPELVGGPPLVLHDLQYLHLEGSAYKDLPGGLRTRLRETQLVVHVLGFGTPVEVKSNVFARINAGGLALTPQELRHALVPGRARKLLKELSQSPAFLAATQGSVSDTRMTDREMVLRFLAFLRHGPDDQRAADMNGFLLDAMEELNTLSSNEENELRKGFERSMRAAESIFGAHAFRRRNRGDEGKRRPVNRALFDTIAVNLARRTDLSIQRLVDRRGEVNEALATLLEEPEFERSISTNTGSSARVRVRFARVDSLFSEFERPEDD